MNTQKRHIVVRNRYFPGLILIIQDEYTKNVKDTHLLLAQHLVNKTSFAMIRDLRPWWVHVFVQVGLSLLVLPWKVTISATKFMEVDGKCTWKIGKNGTLCYFMILHSLLGDLPSRELTYPPNKAYLKLIFLFPRWDM